MIDLDKNDFLIENSPFSKISQINISEQTLLSHIYPLTTNKVTIKIIVLLLQVVIYMITIAALYFRRKSQILINRSPYLMIISIFCSFLIMISNTLIMFLPDNISNNSSYINTNDYSNLKVDTIRDDSRSSFNCSFFNFNTNFTFLFVLLCYILRAKRLNKIFKIISNEKVARIKERFYIKFLIITILFCVALFLVFYYQENLSTLLVVGYIDCTNTKTTEQINTSNYIEVVVFIIIITITLYGIVLVRDIKDKFSISSEISTVLSLYFLIYLVEIVFILTVDNRSFYSTFLISIGIAKACVCLIFSGFRVLLISMAEARIPVCYTVESTKKFSLLVYNEKALKSFLKFLTDEYTEGAKLLILYIRLETIYEQIAMSNNMKEDSKLSYFNKFDNQLKLKFGELIENYFDESSDLYVEVPFNLKPDNIDLMKKIELKNLIGALVHHCYNKLREEYFPLYKRSFHQRTLEKELTEEEIIFTRLCQGSDLDYNLTDYEY